jgi:antitoxin MazE
LDIHCRSEEVFVKSKIARWGNSLALRLPADVVREFGLKEGQLVEIDPEKPNLRIRTERPMVEGVPVYTLEEMVAEMDRFGPENEPEMVDWGPDRGSEIIDDDYSRGVVTLEDVLNGRSAQRG